MEMDNVERRELPRRQVFGKEESARDDAGLCSVRQAIESITAARNYYERIGVPQSACEMDVRRHYRSLAKIIYPDVVPSALYKEAEAAIKLLNEAYEVLKDSEKRRAYDLTLHRMTAPTSRSDCAQYRPSCSDRESNDFWELLGEVRAALEQRSDLQRPESGGRVVLGDMGECENRALKNYSRALRALSKAPLAERAQLREALRGVSWQMERLLEPLVAEGRSVTALTLMHETLSLRGRRPREELASVYKMYLKRLLAWDRGTSGVDDALKVSKLWGVDISSQISRVMARPKRGWFAARIDAIRAGWFFFTH